MDSSSRTTSVFLVRLVLLLSRFRRLIGVSSSEDILRKRQLLKFGQKNRAWALQEGKVQARSEWSDTEPTNTRASPEELVHDNNNAHDKSSLLIMMMIYNDYYKNY